MKALTEKFGIKIILEMDDRMQMTTLKPQDADPEGDARLAFTSARPYMVPGGRSHNPRD
ncbi:MAG: hypothetical protein U5N86_07560 [Planctomycetota bacterium]|nr:hypothetical protein [Planctomycetota bacterium]